MDEAISAIEAATLKTKRLGISHPKTIPTWPPVIVIKHGLRWEASLRTRYKLLSAVKLRVRRNSNNDELGMKTRR
jgi:hypothetical protein